MSHTISKLQFGVWAMILGLLSVALDGCIPIKAVLYGAPGHKDIERFRSSTIEAGEDCFQFYTDSSSVAQNLKVNEWSSGTPFFVTLDQLVENHPVRSFLVIRNDTLLYEYYGKGKHAETINPSYSVAKSFTSALIGIAISEGHIKSERDFVIDYIPEIKDVPMAKDLRIEHLLNMTSGIKYTLRTDAILYYGNDVKKILKNVEFVDSPGTRQHYLNINVQLLGLILHRSTGKLPSEYLEQKIWGPINMCSDAKWTVDKKGEDLTYCCLAATALDYAKFGRLYLNKGSWNGKHIVPESWYEKSIRRDTTEGSSFGYNYNWHIGEKAYGDFMADGLYKQHIYVHPKKNVLIVLMVDKEQKLKAERVVWRNIFRQIVDQL